jgi:hypothetical protein
MMITLEDFVSKTLTQLIKGVKKAQEEAAKLGAVISPQKEQNITNNLTELKRTKVKVGQITREVNFDIAITACEETQSKGGIGVFVLGIVGLGSQGQSQNATSSVNRISFTIPINLPSQPNDIT